MAKPVKRHPRRFRHPGDGPVAEQRPRPARSLRLACLAHRECEGSNHEDCTAKFVCHKSRCKGNIKCSDHGDQGGQRHRLNDRVEASVVPGEESLQVLVVESLDSLREDVRQGCGKRVSCEEEAR
eukprot:scaffold94231_cov28-Tisochrysis_lutea.AAC.2